MTPNPGINTTTSSKNTNAGKNDSAASSIIPGVAQERIDGMKDKFSGVMEGINGNVDRATGFIKARPMMTFAAAIGVGFLVGTLILRSKGRLNANFSSNNENGSV